MEISLEKVGKKFEREWIFQNLSLDLKINDRIVIKGGNGSGKSTLLQILLGRSIPSIGSIKFKINGKLIAPSEVYKFCSIASPYLELIEDFTLIELLETHFSLVTLKPGISLKDIPEILYLEKDKYKPVYQYSSGMKQRVKLALAILSDTPLLLLDEPTSNLDKKGIEWYQKILQDNMNNRIIAVASNEKIEEYSFTEKEISIENFK